MTYKLPYKGMSRIPSGKGFTINISEDDLKSEKSASPEPPKEISYEGQGGKDYENRPEDAINPEGQGGKDYSDYEDSMSRKQSPLNHRDKNGKPIQGDYPGNKQGANHSHPNPIDTSNLSHFDKKPKEQKPKPKKSLEDKAKEILAKKK